MSWRKYVSFLLNKFQFLIYSTDFKKPRERKAKILLLTYAKFAYMQNLRICKSLPCVQGFISGHVLSCVQMTKICVYANFAYMQILHTLAKVFFLCVHMAFKDQQNLSKVEILFYKSNSHFLELRTCLNILIWILQVSKLLLGESTNVTMHML